MTVLKKTTVTLFTVLAAGAILSTAAPTTQTMSAVESAKTKPLYTNVAYINNALKASGYNKAARCAILANGYQETRNNPDHNTATSIGFLYWGGSHVKAIKKSARRQGVPATSARLQVNYLTKTLPASLRGFKTSTSAPKAALSFRNQYLHSRPNGAEWGTVVNAANACVSDKRI